MITRKESPFEKYELLEQVGIGSFGSVFKAKEKTTNETVAIKVMKKKFNTYSECKNLKEYKTLKRMTFHPNIVQLFESFIGPTKDVYFVMEYMNGGNLYQFINERKEANEIINFKEIRSILYQIISALHHLHSVEGIFHRDMKPENLLITTDNFNVTTVKLADFGLAADIKKLTWAPYTDYVSTRWYRAPEVLLKSSNYSAPIDLWAVGTIFAELITLKPLFPGLSEIDQLFRICQVLGSPSSSVITTTTKSYAILQPPSFITSKTRNIIPEQNNINTQVGIGGEWKDGAKLAHKLGFQFPKIASEIESLSTVLHPHSISDDGIDLLSKLLQLDPHKRITSTNALSHPFFTSFPIQKQPKNIVLPPIITNITNKPILFDLPTIPLSPFRLGEGEDYSNQWDLLVKSPITSTHVHKEIGQYGTAMKLTRTTSFPNISVCDDEEYCSNSLYKLQICDGHLMKRSVSDLSIPSVHLPTPQDITPKPHQYQQKKKVNRLSLWAKKHIVA
ncbi:unnamed protein product [Mucor hiemalis]